jgi:hypothetical protein
VGADGLAGGDELMILNGRTDSHGMYQPDRRARRSRPRPEKAPTPARERGVTPDPNGSFEQRCAWMRERQMRRRSRA